MASSVSVCVCDCPCVSGWASSCSPPQDVHKSIAPERAKLLAHLTLDCFLFRFDCNCSAVIALATARSTAQNGAECVEQ
jgi:hypothetical protein